jgi:CubicO group peptidase (beta-lactamase class C family)
MRKVLPFLVLVVLYGGARAQSLYFPPLGGTTWDTLSPASLGWCQPQIDSLLDYLGDRNTKAFMVLKDGKIVIEHYYGTFTADSSWYWASAGKSLTAVLTGIAQQEGYLSINDTSSKYLGAGWTSAPLPKENLITVRNQLTMTSGLDDNVADKDCTDDTCLLYLADAGTRWAYHNAPYTLLDGVIESATGMSLNTYFLQKLTFTTGMTGLYLQQGYNNVFFSKPRSMARFGLMMLNHGNWNGQQLLDTNFLNQMINTSQPLNQSYGYLWWLNGKASHMLPGLQFVFPGSMTPSAPADMYSAMGKNGQILNIVPSMNMIMIRLGDPPSAGSAFVPNFFNDTIWQKFNAVLCNVSAVEEPEIAPSVYPNPASDQLYIDLPGKVFDISILNLEGKEMQQKRKVTGRCRVDLSLAPGLYIAQIKSGNKMYHHKLVVH